MRSDLPLVIRRLSLSKTQKALTGNVWRRPYAFTAERICAVVDDCFYQVSSKSGVTQPSSSIDPEAQGPSFRTATECKIRWLGDRHPRWNHDAWGADEVEKLRNIYKRMSNEARKDAKASSTPNAEARKNGKRKASQMLSDVEESTNEIDGGCKQERLTVDWAQVATELGVMFRLLILHPITDFPAYLQTNRTPIDCMRHAIAFRSGYRFTLAADNRLLDLVQRYGTDNWGIGVY
jgi:hypothetical protein